MARKLNNANGILIALARGKVKRNYQHEDLIKYLNLLSVVISVVIIATVGYKSLFKTRKSY